MSGVAPWQLAHLFVSMVWTAAGRTACEHAPPLEPPPAAVLPPTAVVPPDELPPAVPVPEPRPPLPLPPVPGAPAPWFEPPGLELWAPPLVPEAEPLAPPAEATLLPAVPFAKPPGSWLTTPVQPTNGTQIAQARKSLFTRDNLSHYELVSAQAGSRERTPSNQTCGLTQVPLGRPQQAGPKK